MTQTTNMQSAGTKGWRFWIDRGGTFTDIVAISPDGSLVTHKLLSESAVYDDPAIAGIRTVMRLQSEDAIPLHEIREIKMGTTIATNALLERTGARTALCITRGFRDALRIGYQNRPRLFDRHICLPSLLYETVVEVDERLDANGKVLAELDIAGTRRTLQAVFDQGFRVIAVALLHAYRYPDHELTVERLAKDIGFTHVSVSHKVSPLIKLIPRGDTTVVDAYLSPVLRRYVDQLETKLCGTKLAFMQSNGGLTDARAFQGKNAILSGPAGGVVGMVLAAQRAGLDKVIGFDMGGTSTDVSHFAGELERVFDREVAGVRVHSPMMSIHTVAAGGGSILHFTDGRFQVGPESAGANPGPASYRRGGPLTVTDCNVLLGKIQPSLFPQVFGKTGREPLDLDIVREKFAEMAARISAETKQKHTSESVAEGFLEIAVNNMANAIESISLARGYDITEYALNTFGGAGGQHACLVAERLGMNTILIHSLAGVLSAYGIGRADVRCIRERSAEIELSDANMSTIEAKVAAAEQDAITNLRDQGVAARDIRVVRKVHLRYEGTDTALEVNFARPSEMIRQFEIAYKRRFSFIIPTRPVIVGAVSVEALASAEFEAEVFDLEARAEPSTPVCTVDAFSRLGWRKTPVYMRAALRPGDKLDGPAIIVDHSSTTVVEPGWKAELRSLECLVLTWVNELERSKRETAECNPVLLGVFNGLFMASAEQMGLRLQQTAQSTNIKERLDFSCAIFDSGGNLIANAPHIPVHLGSMGESVKAILRDNEGKIRPGDAFATNDPYQGGTHLPDITVVTPVFGSDPSTVQFYVASRGHHADVGGITPGSMPPMSSSIEEEGVLFRNWKLTEEGRFREAETLELLKSSRFPARNPAQNISDLRAQVAANAKGGSELRRMMDDFGVNVVQAYTRHVQDNAERAVRQVIQALSDGEFALEMDSGAVIRVRVRVDQEHREAAIDFTGTSAQVQSNLNAPAAICVAAVLFVFRSLVNRDIPLNAGCLKPLTIIAPAGSMLNPRYPAAVVAGNVETSQCITNALFGALGVCAASQCTMNCLSFGNADFQYIETIAGGSGAGPGYGGTDAVHTNMTNSLITDPEILEHRYPVVLETFAIRPNTGGGGRWKGGNGVVRALRFMAPVTASIISNNRLTAPFGMAGGQAGATGRNSVRRADGSERVLGSCATLELSAGETLVIETPGGGGYGYPDVA